MSKPDTFVSFGSFVSESAVIEKKYQGHKGRLIKKTYIMKHGAGKSRDNANMRVAQRHDYQRKTYQGSREDAEQVAVCYRAIVTDWLHCEYADLPPVPPNLREWPELQEELWLLFWNAVESSKGA